VRNYCVLPGVVDGEVVEPVVPPLPTVPEDEPPMPVLPEPLLVPAPALPEVLPEVELPAPAEPDVLPEAPVLAPRSDRHFCFCVTSVSFSQAARADAESAEPEVTPPDPDVPAEPEVPVEPDTAGEDELLPDVPALPDVLPAALPEDPALEESVDEVDGVDDCEVLGLLEVDGELELELPDVWATATDVAARKAAAIAACKIFMFIECSSAVGMTASRSEQSACRQVFSSASST